MKEGGARGGEGRGDPTSHHTTLPPLSYPTPPYPTRPHSTLPHPPPSCPQKALRESGESSSFDKGDRLNSIKKSLKKSSSTLSRSTFATFSPSVLFKNCSLRVSAQSRSSAEQSQGMGAGDPDSPGVEASEGDEDDYMDAVESMQGHAVGWSPPQNAIAWTEELSDVTYLPSIKFKVSSKQQVVSSK